MARAVGVAGHSALVEDFRQSVSIVEVVFRGCHNDAVGFVIASEALVPNYSLVFLPWLRRRCGSCKE